MSLVGVDLNERHTRGVEVVRESGGGSSTNLSFPMLKCGDYTHWAMVMEVNLQAASLWDAIEDDTVPRREDKQALAALLRSTR